MKKIKDILEAKNIANFLEIWLTDNLIPITEQNILNHYYRSYKKYFGNYIKTNYCQQTMELISLVSQFKNPKVLEVGSGCGTESLWLSIHGANVTGIDIDNRLLSVAIARKKVIEKYLKTKIPCNFIKKSLLELNSNEKFDIIWMEQTFHHLEPRSKILDKLSKLVNKNGYIIISETNAWNPLNQLFFLKVRGFNTIIDFNGYKMGNERITTPGHIGKELKKRNIKKISIRYFRTMPNLPIADKFKFLDHVIPQFVPIFFTHYNYVGKKE